MSTDARRPDLAIDTADLLGDDFVQDAVDLAASINRRLQGKLARLRMTRSSGLQVDCRVLDGQVLASLIPDDERSGR